jgi:hypothetical protein
VSSVALPRIALLTLTLLVSYAFTFPRWADWNQNSRLDQTLALVNDGHWYIDDYRSNTGDFAYYNGHYYSDKAPGVALLGVPVYAVLHTLIPEKSVAQLRNASVTNRSLAATQRAGGEVTPSDQDAYFFVILLITTLVTIAIPSVALGVLFFTTLGTLGLAGRGQVIASLLYCLGTCGFAYSNALYSHQLSALFVFAAFVILIRVQHTGGQEAWFGAVGALLGCAVVCEYPATIVGLILTGFAMWIARGRVRPVVLLIAGGLPPLVVLAVVDWLPFGTVLPVAYQYSALFPAMRSGFFSVSVPTWEAVWGITFSPYRGLFFLSPYLLFATLGYWHMWARRRRSELCVLLAAPVAMILFTASSTLWDGGFAVGPRYLIVVLPLLGLAAGVGIIRAWGWVTIRPLVVLTSASSVAVVWAESLAGQSFPDYSTNPLIDLSLRRLGSGDVARNIGMLFGLSGWSSLVPLMLFIAICVTLLLMPRAELPLFRARRTTEAVSLVVR